MAKALSQQLSPRIVESGTAFTVTPNDAGDVINLGAGVAATVTLPKSEGTGNLYRFRVSATGTGSQVIKVSNTNDVISGFVFMIDTDTAGTTTGWATNATSDTITLNRSTTGGVTLSEELLVTDGVSGTFFVRGYVSNTGTGATPFSATV